MNTAVSEPYVEVGDVESKQSGQQARNWRRLLAAYTHPYLWRSVSQLSLNLAAYFLLLSLSIWLVPRSLALSLLLAIPAAGFILRLFSIQHDCGHRSFFKSKRVNEWVGRIISPITLTPFRFWQVSHAKHHASVGHLERQGFGDIEVLTTKEYQSSSPFERLKYRIYRHPIVLFFIGPIYIYYIRFRLPIALPEPKMKSAASIVLTNISLLAIGIAVNETVGLTVFLWAFLPMTTLAGIIGIWLFYVHHYFDETYWADNSKWQIGEAQVGGTSYYALPRILRFYTGNTGIHHIHHVCPRIPNYRLQGCLDDHAEFKDQNAITLLKSLSFAWLALWDETEGKMISFKELANQP